MKVEQLRTELVQAEVKTTFSLIEGAYLQVKPVGIRIYGTTKHGEPSVGLEDKAAQKLLAALTELYGGNK